MNESFLTGDVWVFVGLTLTLGGVAAFAAGRSLAQNWGPLWLLALYALPLCFGLRFLHWSLFAEPLDAPYAAALAYGWVLAVESLGYRMTRVAMMARQYPWIFAHKGGMFLRRTKS